MEPRVSVLLPTFDRAAYLGDAVDSVLRQTMADFELIVVDDGSTDGTPQLLAAVDDPRLRVIRQENRGIAAALNMGIRAARGEYVARNDSDDLWLPDLLETLVPALDARPDVGLVWGRASMMDAAGSPIPGSRGSPPRFAEEGFRSLLHVDCTASIASVYRRACLEQAGGFDEALRTDSDWDMALRVARDHPILFVDREVARIRTHGGNITSLDSPRLAQRIASRARVLDKVFADPGLSPEHAALESAARRNLRTGAAMQWFEVGNGREGRRALRQAFREGGHPLATAGRIAWSAVMWFGVGRFRWTSELVRRLSTKWRSRTPAIGAAAARRPGRP